MAQIKADAHWRDSARDVKFLIWDAKTAFPIAFMFIYASWWTLFFSVFTMMFFTILNRYGFSMATFGRWLRAIFAGPRKQTRPWWLL